MDIFERCKREIEEVKNLFLIIIINNNNNNNYNNNYIINLN
jgi:hypothetical protein